MKIRQGVLGLVAMLAALPALADGIDGKWTASVDSPQGAMQLQFEFKAGKDGKLEGALSADMLPTTPITEGTIKGDQVTFRLNLVFAEGMPSLVIDYKGTVKGDKLELLSVLDMGQGPTETALVAARVK